MTGQLEQKHPFHLSIVSQILTLREDDCDAARHGLEILGALIQSTVIPHNHSQIAGAFKKMAEEFGVENAFWVSDTLRSIEAQ